MKVEYIDWLIGIVPGIAVALLFFILTPEEGIDDGPGGYGSSNDGKKKSLFLKLFGGIIYSFGQVISTLPIEKNRKVLEKKLTQAGRPGNLSANEFHAARIVGILLAAAAGFFIDSEVRLYPICTICLGALGLIYPDIWLSGLINKRRRRIFRDLPDTLDLLRLAVDAGMDLSSAMKVVVEKGRKGPLLDELEKVERDISLGRTRADAFRSFSERIAMSEINSFVLALIQADSLGASVGPVLKIQGDTSRTKRWQLAEALVNKMPMKMLAPLVVFIFPASFIILFTPLLIQWMQSG